MKILYAIQGTGNGHLSRARDIIPHLSALGDVDILISGIQADVDFPFPVKYRYQGLSLIFGKNGGVDVFLTFKKSNLRRLLKEINHLPVEDYHLVISDFEPVSAWACLNKGIPCIGLSHQVAILEKKAPKPRQPDLIGPLVLKNYAPVSAYYGFHFQAYAKGIFTPVIRRQVRDLQVSSLGHYVVYLPAYSDKRIIKVLSRFGEVHWEVFSKHSKKSYSQGNCRVSPIDNEAFLESLAGAEGVICGAGFETPAEVLFLKKKLMVIPMKGQYEQQCNAAALKKMGVPVIRSLTNNQVPKIGKWLSGGKIITVDYPDETKGILEMILARHAGKRSVAPASEKGDATVKTFKRLTMVKALARMLSNSIKV